MPLFSTWDLKLKSLVCKVYAEKVLFFLKCHQGAECRILAVMMMLYHCTWRWNTCRQPRYSPSVRCTVACRGPSVVLLIFSTQFSSRGWVVLQYKKRRPSAVHGLSLEDFTALRSTGVSFDSKAQLIINSCLVKGKQRVGTDLLLRHLITINAGYKIRPHSLL